MSTDLIERRETSVERPRLYVRVFYVPEAYHNAAGYVLGPGEFPFGEPSSREVAEQQLLDDQEHIAHCEDCQARELEARRIEPEDWLP